MNPRNRNMIIAVVAVALVLCCCCVVTAGVIVFLDPFGWGLLSLFSPQGETISKAIPADTPMYATTDLTALASPKVARILKAFADVPGAADYTSTEKATEQIDKALQDQFGLTLTDDILPWVGRYAGLSVAKIPSVSGNPDPADYVLLVEARNTQKAGEFVTKLVNALVDKSGYTAKESTYKGVTLHIVSPSDVESYGEQWVMALSKNLVLLSLNESAVQTAIDAQTGATPAAAAAADFKSLRQQMPADSLLALVVSGPAIQAYLQELQSSLGGLTSGLNTSQTGLEAVRSIGVSISVVDAGLRFDSLLAFDETQLSDAQRQYYAVAAGGDQIARLLPDNTLVYVSGQRLDLAWAVSREAMNSNDFKDGMQAFADQFGFNPDEALLPYLKSGWALAVLPDAQSILATQLQAGEFGFAVLAETSDAPAVGETLTALNTSLEGQGLTIDTPNLDGNAAFSLNSGGEAMGVYGVTQNYLTIASSEQTYTDLFNKGASLADAAGYQQAWRAFPNGTQHTLYADVTGLVDLTRQGMTSTAIETFDQEVAPYLKPLTALAVGNTPLKNGVAQGTLIVFIAGGQ